MSQPADQGARFPHLPALDGLRGAAVALVVAYHLAPSALPGGFLGVDVFFVLSGFLITSLLLDELRLDGSVDLGRFYVRRVRRLAPALLLLLGAGCVYAALWATPGELSRLREHSLWTLGYLANWRFIADGTTYTDLVAGQSPLRHTWSLAIEEQFYVVFPLVLIVAGWCVRWRYQALRWVILAIAIVGSVGSAAWMAVRWSDVGDPSRGYFGTDTRAHSLLVGVALGAVLVGRPPRVGRSAVLAAAAGVVGVAGLVVAVLVSHETSSALQHGGFLFVALAVAGTISAMERSHWLRAGLSIRPLVALGVISYGVYLWHWPIVVLVDESRTGLDGPLLGAVRIGLTLGAATLSYRLVERPIRRGVLGHRVGRPALAALPAGAAALVALVVWTTALPGRPTPAAATPDPPVSATENPPGSVASAAEPAVPLPVGALMVGDSVAHTLAGGTVGDFPDFEPWSPEQSPFDPRLVRLWSATKPACSYLPGGVLGEGPIPADLSPFCGAWAVDMEQALVDHPSSVVVVALANDASNRSIDGRTVELGTPEHDALVAGLLDEIRSIARRHGADVVLVALPPRTDVAATSMDADGRRERLMRDALWSYAAARPGVQTIDLFDQICPAGDCERPAPGFDPGWRYDGMHYSVEGARWVADWLAQQLTLARPPS